MSRNEDQFDPCAPINSLPCTLLRLHLRTVLRNVHGGIAETEIYRADTCDVGDDGNCDASGQWQVQQIDTRYGIV